MQVLIEKLGLGNGASTIPIWLGLGFVFLVIVVSLGSWLLRSLRPSLNMGGQGRAGRPQRLAITDAFNLDKEGRKLVIIRRDNVEHLLLIGGSNDVLVEANIMRSDRGAQYRAARQQDEPHIYQAEGGSAPIDFNTVSETNGRPTATLSTELAPPSGVQANSLPRQPVVAVTIGSSQPPATAQSNNNLNYNNAPNNINPSAQLASLDMRFTPPTNAPAGQVEGYRQPQNGGNNQPNRGSQNQPPNSRSNNQYQDSQSVSSKPAASSSFEDEFEKVLAGMGTSNEAHTKPTHEQARPGAAQPIAEAKNTPLSAARAAPAPSSNNVNKVPPPPMPASMKVSMAPSPPSPAQKNEPASEMARRLNEVLQRPLNAAKQQEGLGKSISQQAPALDRTGRSQSAPLPPPAESDMDLLEEEMARLLGRVSLPSKKSLDKP